jgi:hypothetical protein
LIIQGLLRIEEAFDVVLSAGMEIDDNQFMIIGSLSPVPADSQFMIIGSPSLVLAAGWWKSMPGIRIRSQEKMVGMNWR